MDATSEISYQNTQYPHRLSEDPNTSVGVIEAGGYDKDVPEINVPGPHISCLRFLTRTALITRAGNLGRLITDPKFDWTFWSTPQAHANDRIILQPRGKALGGSSMVRSKLTIVG